MTTGERPSRRARLASLALLGVTLLSGGCATVPDAAESDAAKAEATEVVASSAEEAIRQGDAALMTGDLDRALYSYVQALQLDDANPDTFFKVGRIHQERGNGPLAEAAFRSALERAPDHAASLTALGSMLLERRAYPEAEQMLTAATTGDPRQWRAWNGLGVIADLKREFDRARGHYERALAVAPNSASVLNNLGYSRYLAGDWHGARDAFGKALAADPQHRLAWRNTGLLYARQRRYGDAVEALKHTTETPGALNDVGYIAMIEGNVSGARTLFKEAIQQSPSYYVRASENVAALDGARAAALARSEPVRSVAPSNPIEPVD
jgi:Flp pilus assembly protein TadD